MRYLSKLFMILLLSCFICENICFVFTNSHSYSNSRSYTKHSPFGSFGPYRRRRKRRRRHRRCGGFFNNSNPFGGWSTNTSRPPVINAGMNINNFEGIFNHSNLIGSNGGRGNTMGNKKQGFY